MTNFSSFFDAANASFPERKEVFESLLDSLIAKQHVLLLGPPGTAKTKTTGAFAKAAGKSFFDVQLHRQLPLEEIFGPLNIPEFEKGKYVRRNANFAPEAEIVLLDEVFKAGGVALNPLLTYLESRTVKQDGVSVPVKTEMVVGVSNELPEDGLEALNDRFICRHWVAYIKDQNTAANLISGCIPDFNGNIDPKELAQAQLDMENVTISSDVANTLVELVHEARTRGIAISDRRMHKAAQMLKARAARMGDSAVSHSHFSILEFIFWNKQEEIPVIQELLRAIQPTWMKDIQDINKMFDEIKTELGDLLKSNDSRSRKSAALSKLNARLLDIKEQEIDRLATNSEAKPALEDVLARASKMSRDIVKNMQVIGAFNTI